MFHSYNTINTGLGNFQLMGKTAFTTLRDLPGVGPSIEKDLHQLGFSKPADLIGANPQAMYEKWTALNGGSEKCMLYVFRCAVYCVNTPRKKLKLQKMQWWNWKIGR